MPHMGVSVEQGTVTEWRVKVGDRVHAGQVICEIATDKVDTEVVSPADGVVKELLVGEGDTAAVGSVLARLDDGAGVAGAGDPAPAVAPSAEPGPPGSPARVEVRQWLAGARVDPAAAAEALVARPGRHGGPIASPVARRMATQHRIELSSVRGTGHAGRIRRVDVVAAVAAVAGRGVALPLGYADVPFDVVRSSPHRLAIAEHMSRSRQTAAHMTTEVEVDMHHVGAVREEVNAERAQAGRARITYLSFVARAAIAVLTRFPDLNATFLGEHAVHWRPVNLGIAIDTDSGLIVPVIRGAETLPVAAIADRIADLAERARARRLMPDDLTAGTFTVSNPGSVGAVSAPAIINQPQVAILGMPAIVKRPWVLQTADGTDVIAPRPIMKLALTFDHRAVDGARATRYIVAVKELLESWNAPDYA